MKSGYLVSLADSFEEDVWRAVASLGADVRDHVGQVRDDQDRLVTVFGDLDPSVRGTGRRAPSRTGGPAPPPT